MRYLFFIAVLIMPLLAQSKTLPKDLQWETNNSADTWADPNATKGGVFNDYIISFPPTLRTIGPDSNNSFRSFINANKMGLVSFHPTTWEIIPEIATHWAYGADKKTVYYKLDPAAKWSDGKSVTADDFLYTIKFMRSPHINAPWYNNHYTEQFEDVSKYDDHTISITGAVARSKEELHYYYGLGPTPEHFYGELDGDWVKKHNWKIVPNTGPYQISKIKKGKSVEFSLKENWWAKDYRYNKGRYNVNKVVIKVIRDDNIAFRHFEKGDIDSFDLVHPDYWHNKAKGKLFDNGYIHKVLFYNDMPRSASGFFLNMDKPILSDNDTRIGVAYALNFEKVIKTVLRDDYERLNAFHEGYGDYSNKNVKARPFDLEKANHYLTKAGWTEYNGSGIRIKNGKELSLEISYARKEHTDRWTIIKQDAKKAGINLELKLQDATAQYKTVMQKQHDIAAMGWSTGFKPAFWQHFHSDNAHKPQTNNVTNFDDKQIDDLIMEYRFETDTSKRIALSQKLEQMIHDSAAFIPSFKVSYTRGAHWRWLKFPKVPGTKTSATLYSPFGNGGVFWIDSKMKIDTMAARKSSTRYTPVNNVYEQFKVTQ